MILKNTTAREWIVLTSLIAIAVACRLYLEIPNFKPIAAFALFGGFYFRRPRMAIIGMLVAMLLTDSRLGIYPWQEMLANYLALSLAAGLGLGIRRLREKQPTSWKWVATFIPASLAMSAAFFLLSNGAVWAFSGWYPRTMTALAECFVNAIPFFRWTWLGDLCFTVLTVGGYLVISTIAERVVARDSIDNHTEGSEVLNAS